MYIYKYICSGISTGGINQLLTERAQIEGWEADQNIQKRTGPGRMVETPRAGTGDFACRS